MSPKTAAPADLTGYWVSIVTTEDQWMLRMAAPVQGNYQGIFLTPEGRKLADSWDPAKEEAGACKAYGAAAIMMVPGHLHITWENDATLRIDADAGSQTRIFNFRAAAPPSGEAPLQGYSAARWDSQGGRGTEAGESGYRKTGNALKVVTTHMRAGYLYKNGIPYSANAVLTEYFNRVNEPNGEMWLAEMLVLEDPQYFAEPFVRTLYFKKLPDGSRWSPSPCSVR